MKRTRYIKPIYLSLLFLLLLYSCETNKEIVESNNSKLLNIGYSITDLSSRALVTADESNITEALLLFYTKDTEEYVDFAIAKASETDFNLNLKMGDNLVDTEEYKVLILGNFSSYSSLNYQEFVEANRSVLYEDLKKSVKAEAVDEERVASPLPYAGVLVDSQGKNTLFRVSNYNEQSLRLNYNIKFQRIVTRVDLVNRVPNELTIKWVKVVNYRSESYYFNDLIIGQLIENKKSAEGSRGVVKPNDQYSNGQLVSQHIEGGLYLFPNISQYIGQSDKSTSALLICGNYQGSLTDSYYRINIGRPEGNQTFRDNGVYKVNIHSVLNEGDASEEEAMRNKNLNVFYQVNTDWVDDGSELVSDNQGHYLSVSTTTKSFKGIANDDFHLFVETNKEADFSFEFLDAHSAQDQYFTISQGENYLKVSTKLDNNAAERSNRIKITHTGNPNLYKIIELSQRDNRIPGLIIEYNDNGIIETHTSDFTVYVDAKVSVETSPRFTVFIADKEVHWRTVFLAQSGMIHTLVLEKPYGKDGEELVTLMGYNDSEKSNTYLLEVNTKDVEPIVIKIVQAGKKNTDKMK